MLTYTELETAPVLVPKKNMCCTTYKAKLRDIYPPGEEQRIYWLKPLSYKGCLLLLSWFAINPRALSFPAEIYFIMLLDLKH